MFYQLSQSTKVCRRMLCIGSNIYYTAIRGGCQDRRRENFLLSVWRAAKARGMGFVPRPTPLLFSACTFLYPHLRISLHERFAVQHAHLPVPAPADKPPRTLAVQRTRTFPPPRPRTGSPRTPCGLSARTFLRPRLRTGFPRTLAVQRTHLPASAPADRLSTNACCFSTFPRPRPRTGPPRTLCGLSARGSSCRRSSRRPRHRGCRCPGGRGWRG